MSIVIAIIVTISVIVDYSYKFKLTNSPPAWKPRSAFIISNRKEIWLSLSPYIYIYIYIERERERYITIIQIIYMYIYIYIHFKSSVSNPKSKYVAYVSVLSQISNCQGLGRKNKHEIVKTDRNDNNNNNIKITIKTIM